MGLNLCLSCSLNASRMTEALIITLHPARPATCCTMYSENLGALNRPLSLFRFIQGCQVCVFSAEFGYF